MSSLDDAVIQVEAMREPLAISALQHYVFCRRQCALIHVEGLWLENRLTVEGTAMHRRVHAEEEGPRGGGRVELRGRTRIVRALPLCSVKLGIIGKADVVEFRAPPGKALRRSSALGVSPSTADSKSLAAFLPPASLGQPPAALPLSAGPSALGTPFPIEYKRGRPKRHDADLVQLCAQAFCLEEMLELPAGTVSAGAIYYGKTKHRLEVTFSTDLRVRTVAVIEACRAMIDAGSTPCVKPERKCRRCSMRNLCLPEATSPFKSASRYVAQALDHSLSEPSPDLGGRPR